MGKSNERSLRCDGGDTNRYDYTYDDLRRPISRNADTFAYNRRVVKIAADGSHTFLYDGWRPIVETIIRPDATTDRIDYVWGKDISGAPDGAAGLVGLLYVKLNGAVFVPIYDAYGNVMGYRNAEGNTVAEYVYDAFGLTVAQNGTMADVFAIRYSTKYYDKETRLYYYGKRYYAPSWRRWLTRDPIGEEGGVNLYGFCGNNAIYKYDAFGQKETDGWKDLKSTSEMHVWNCSEWPNLTDNKPGGTQGKYIAHFSQITFKKDLPVPDDYVRYFAYGIVSMLGMSNDPSAYWCLDLVPLRLQGKCEKGKYKYRIVMSVRRLDKHSSLSATPEFHIVTVEGRTFTYGPK